VVTDGPALESSLKNLFENALKYAARGKWLSVSACVAQNTKGREVQITVADRGPGIAPKALPHIFEPFYRGQSETAATTSGAGLGLCLVKRNLRALGGSVTVRSALGDGTSVSRSNSPRESFNCCATSSPSAAQRFRAMNCCARFGAMKPEC
jgi:signal transduction histidine kinase